MNPSIQTWSALLIGDTNGILAAPGSTWDGHPEHYERAELVRKSELDAALIELSSYRKCCRECDKILDALPDATEDPIYIQLQRIINGRDLANDTIKGLEGNLEACESDNEQLRARISKLEQWKSEQLQLESMWDEQSVGRLLGVRLGEMIRPNIEPKILGLLSRISELEYITNCQSDLLAAQSESISRLKNKIALNQPPAQ